MKITVAITGASGTIYAKRLCEVLVAVEEVTILYIVFTKTALKVAQWETSTQSTGEQGGDISWLVELQKNPKVRVLDNDDYFVPIASGSSASDKMVVVPCSVGMVGRIANGISNDLVSRAADVMQKERRDLILVVRETPFSTIHLENMLKLSKVGALVMPASVSFYSRPTTVEHLVDTVVERIVAQLRLEYDFKYGWDSQLGGNK